MVMEEGTIRVTDRAGATHELPAIAGWSLMELIRDAGLPIKAECGGAAACATCHVYVAAAWQARLPPPREDERERLDQDAYDLRPESRLACQILWTPDLECVEVKLAPEMR